MRLPFRLGRREYVMEPIGEEHAAALAELHQESFAHPWSETEFEALVAQDSVSGFVAREFGKGRARPAGFVLVRVAGEEAEILSIAVASPHRRRGVGWALMDAVLRQMHGERVAEIFLEVDETNVAATVLYRRLGFSEVGRRPAYYRSEGEDARGALVMRRDLSGPSHRQGDPQTGDRS